MNNFKSKIKITGSYPYVPVPDECLKSICKQAGKNKSPIPVKGTINGHPFTQTLLKFKDQWLVYINGIMREASGTDVNDEVEVVLEYDPRDRSVPMHPKLAAALKKDKRANDVFNHLAPSRQKEILRYISFLKTEESIERNVARAIRFLQEEDRFIGRDKP